MIYAKFYYSHMEQWLQSMRSQGQKELLEAQKNFKPTENKAGRFHRPQGYRNKGLDGVRFLRTFEGDRLPQGNTRGSNR